VAIVNPGVPAGRGARCFFNAVPKLSAKKTFARFVALAQRLLALQKTQTLLFFTSASLHSVSNLELIDNTFSVVLNARL
jgi:hypothetical protein